MWASNTDKKSQALQGWSCAILRVMHTIAHIEGIHLTTNVAAAKAQIFDRFKAKIWRSGDHKWWIGNKDQAIELAHIGWKDHKSRQSIILKLLHKKDNVAESIYDYIGIRLVTKRLSDVLPLVAMLHTQGILSFPNAYPSRARNTLIDQEKFRLVLETLLAKYAHSDISGEEFARLIEDEAQRLAPPGEKTTGSNPHSASDYHSIQMTGRQLIKLPGYRFEWIDKLKETLAAKRGSPETLAMLGEVIHLVEGWHTVESSFYEESFFPFEIQILDEKAHNQSVVGAANHNRYKSSQIKAAKNRVLGQLLAR